MPRKTIIKEETIMKYITGDILFAEKWNISAILDNIISFIVAVVKFEVPALDKYLK